MSARPLNQQNSMPQMTAVFQGWQSEIVLTKRTQKIIDGLVSFKDATLSFQGIIQPLSPRTIALKPEGQRAFTWLQIHCLLTTINLTTNDVIVYNARKYKIMAKLDYTNNGYIEFHAVEDFQ